MKRPRTYRDRRWLDGYMDVAERIGYMDVAEARHLLWIFRARASANGWGRPLTAFEMGKADALLDAVGC